MVLESAAQLLVTAIGSLGYLGIFILMTIESTFIPLPSEIILPPAGYLAFQGQMNFLGIVIAATLGSCAGALINYWLGWKFGKRAITGILRKINIGEHHYEKAEQFFNKHGAVSTFLGRLVIGVRHFISFPAGFAKMNLRSFIAYTFIGSAIWCTFLTAAGYWLGANSALIAKFEWILIGACVVILILYVLFRTMRNRSNRQHSLN